MAASSEFLELQQIKFNLFKGQNPETGFFDVTFEIEGKHIFAHKTMLNMISTTFASMLSDRWNSKQDEPIKIKDYTYDDFYCFLTFLYSGQCELTDTNIFTMVDIAEFYGINAFKKHSDKYLAAKKITTDKIFELSDFTEKYSLVQLKASISEYILNNFQDFSNSDEFLNANRCIMNQIVLDVKDILKSEDVFQAVYKWCEKQAIEKQTVDPSLNFNDTIKAEIAEFLPCFHFLKMNSKFFAEFVVSRGFIFSSYNELSKILSDRMLHSHLQMRVTVTNSRGRTLHGHLIADKKTIENIKSIEMSVCDCCYDKDDESICDCNDSHKYCYWKTKCTFPSTPSSLKETDGVKWYLAIGDNGQIYLEHISKVDESDYLLSYLIPGKSGFQHAHECFIEIE